MTVVDYFNLNGYDTAHAGCHHERQYASENRYRYELWQNDDSNHAEHAINDAIEFLASPNRHAKPFYLNVGTIEVHSSQWQDQTGSWRDVYGITDEDDPYLSTGFPDHPLLRRESRRYHACLQYFDHHVGRLFKAIDRLGLRDNTVVVFTTEHGLSGCRAKSTLYDIGTELSLLIRMPGSGGRVDDTLLQNMDFAPTLLDLAGINIPQNMVGRSFAPLLRDEPYTPHQDICLQRHHHGLDVRDTMRALRTTDYLYIRNYEPGAKERWRPDQNPELKTEYTSWFTELWPKHVDSRPAEELYHLPSDPGQYNNVASKPQFEEVRYDLADRLVQVMKNTCDPVLHTEVFSVNQLEMAAGRRIRWHKERPCEYLYTHADQIK